MLLFNPTDTYNVNRSTDNFKIDTKVLLRLYEPLMGSIAVSLYLTFDSEFKLNTSNRVMVKINRLTKILSISFDEFNKAVETLKNYKLLTVRANKNRKNDYLFKIHLPLMAKEFFEDSRLKEQLKKAVDEDYYQQVYHYFFTAQIDEDDYVEINDLLNKEITDEDFFMMLEDKYQGPLMGIFDDKTKREILRVKKLYHLDYNDIELAIFQSVDYNPNPYINLNRFNESVERNQDVSNKKDANDYQTFLNNLDKTAILTYYCQIFKRTMLPSEENSLLEIQRKYQASNGIVNAAVWYYFQYADKTIRNYSARYIEKIVITLLENHCENAEQAMNYFKDYQKRFKGSSIKKESISSKVQLEKKDVSSNQESLKEELVQQVLKLLEE